MPSEHRQQTPAPGLVIGVDVGGTFTDLVALDPASGELKVVKVPSTPPDFHRAVLDAVRRVMEGEGSTFAQPPHVIHGSTVATNALLQRAGEPVAFITTEGFRDLLLIGRQNRPHLYALRVVRPPPITPEENWFTVRERLDARGGIVTPLEDADVDRLVRDVQRRNLRHAAVCLLFSFVNPDHERRVGRALEAAGITVSLSCDVLPEFREYERASTTAINASLRPTVAGYLGRLSDGLGVGSGEWGVKTGEVSVFNSPLPTPNSQLSITHSGGGTLSPSDAARQAAKLVLSGPAGGVIGAAFVARAAGFLDVITYDMGGTSTDVALVLNGQPQWSTAGAVDGLPIGLPAFDIHTVGAGGGSIAAIDTGGALRVGPRSAGAVPGPACYGRGGHDPTVTDANVVLGRIQADQFLGGGMTIEIDRAVRAVQPLAERMGKSLTDAALGIVRVAEANMAAAVRAVTSQRGHDPRRFALVSFGGAGGLHACNVAAALDVPRVVIPPHSGVLSALGMVVAPPVADASRTVVHLADGLDDARLAAEFAELDRVAARQLPDGRTERFADVRFNGQSYELKVPVTDVSVASVADKFKSAYGELYGPLPQGREAEVVTLRVRRVGRAVAARLPAVEPTPGDRRTVSLVDDRGATVSAGLFTRGGLRAAGPTAGPLSLIDPTATAFVPAGWSATASENGTVVVERNA
jgi:N-methylhydantoinase A